MVNQTLSVQRPARTGSVPHILRTLGASLLKSLSLRHLTVSVIFSILVVYVALIFSADIVMYIAGFTALCSLWLCDSLNPTEGGEI